MAKGGKQIRRALERAKKEHRGALAAAIQQEAFAIDGQSVRLVPTDTARLKNTHFVTRPNNRGNEIEVEVGYGTEYAVPVHERMDLRHTAPQTAKFLEKPMLAAMGGYATRLLKRVQLNLKRGVVTIIANERGTNKRPVDKGKDWQEKQRQRSLKDKRRREQSKKGEGK